MQPFIPVFPFLSPLCTYFEVTSHLIASLFPIVSLRSYSSLSLFSVCPPPRKAKKRRKLEETECTMFGLPFRGRSGMGRERRHTCPYLSFPKFFVVAVVRYANAVSLSLSLCTSSLWESVSEDFICLMRPPHIRHL